MAEGFLLGVVATSSLVAALFFLRFWRTTGDSFFLWFAAAFFIEGLNRTAILLLAHPSEGNSRVYVVRLLASLLILAAIVRKNYGRTG
jgi:hypothetical protein